MRGDGDVEYVDEDWPPKDERGVGDRDGNGTDNSRSKSASVFVFKDMVCTYTNPADMGTDTDFDQPDIRRIS